MGILCSSSYPILDIHKKDYRQNYYVSYPYPYDNNFKI